MSRRSPQRIRPISFVPHFVSHPTGSVLVSMGHTRVLCNVAFEQGVPRWLKDKGQGWLTAEYAMLPQATNTRNQRESVKGKISGRTAEISRLVGRALRAMVDMNRLGENTLMVDCDVLQADGGTRTAAINGASMAVGLAVARLLKSGVLKENPIRRYASALSVGQVQGAAWMDLDYALDSSADMDLNVVALHGGHLVEVQGTAEGVAVSRQDFHRLLDLAMTGLEQVEQAQKKFIKAHKLPAPFEIP